MTIKLCIAVVPLGFALGAIIAIFYSFRMKIVNIFLVIFVDFSFYPTFSVVNIYGLWTSLVGWDVPVFGAVLVAFTINSSSYFGEIIRAGIESIPKGQMEAARSTGLSRLKHFCCCRRRFERVARSHI